MIGWGTNRKALSAQRQLCLTLPARFRGPSLPAHALLQELRLAVGSAGLAGLRAPPWGFGDGGGGRGALVLVGAEACLHGLAVG